VDLRVGAALVRLSRDEAAARLKAAGTAYGFVNTLADLATHPALVRAEVETSAGPARIVAPPVLIDGEVRALGRVPDIGEHSARIRREFGARE
jgi:crotonobetainyl-CoA:carnitine CoA-transferase CaiB-like acyl-CoA transferase